MLNFLNFSHGISLADYVDILMQYVKVARYMSGVLISLSGTLPNNVSVCMLCFLNLEIFLWM